MTDPKMPPNVRVKPLVWEAEDGLPTCLDANGCDKLYRILVRHDGTAVLRPNASRTCESDHPTLEAAKAAAQADYTARIMSALEVVGDDDGLYVPRHVPSGMPTDCCEFGVIDMNKGGIEVCRCWTAEDATLISAALTKGSTDDRT